MRTFHPIWLLPPLLACTAAAHAQSVDYAAFEELFGEPVTASVTGSPQRVSAVPATMDIITAEQIRRSGARDLATILSHVAGVDVLQWGNDHADVGIRGYNQALSPRVLVLLDGRQVYADHHEFTPWAAIPVELAAIRQIEIVKGPNSALFGFNAVGGVVNIVTRNPLQDDVDVVAVTAGTQGLLQGSLVTDLRLREGLALRLMAGGYSNDDFDTPQLPEDLGSRRGNERGSGNVELFWDVGDTEVILEAARSQSQSADMSPVYAVQFQRLDTSAVHLRAASDTRFGLLQGRVYTNWLDTEAGNPGGAGVTVRFRNRVTVAQLADVIKPGAGHTVRTAIEYRSNTVNTTPVAGGEIFYDVLALSAMWEWRLHPNVAITNAVRADHLDLGRGGSIPAGLGLANSAWTRDFTEVSFNTGLVWDPTGIDTLRLTAARGVQIPSLFDYGSGLFSIALPFPPFTIYTGGNPFLEPSVVMHYELAWEHDLPAIGGGLRLALHRENTSRLIVVAGGPAITPAFSGATNAGSSEALGAELVLHGTRSAWRWELGYTPLFLDDDFSAGNSVVNTFADFANTTPKHTAKASLGRTFAGWEADAYVRYHSRAAGIRADPLAFVGRLEPIDAYFGLDARVGWHATSRLDLELSGQNLLESSQRQTSGPDVERRVLGKVTVRF